MADAITEEFDFGKDHVVLMTDTDACIESTYRLPETDPDDNEPRGVVQPNGELNWECPCLGGMPTGPCGIEFREAFTCVQFSKEKPKGMECLDAFKDMQLCMARYPALYERETDDEEDEALDNLEELNLDTNNDKRKESLETNIRQVEDEHAADGTSAPPERSSAK